jgi:hypothetical protein
MPPLSFSDEQLDLVTRAAALLPTHQHNTFLQSISNRIGASPKPTNDDIKDAIDFVLGCRIGGGSKAFIPPRPKQERKGIFR